MQPKTPFELPKPVPPSSSEPSAQVDEPAPTPIRWKWVVRDVLILCATTYWGSKLVGFNGHTLNDQTIMNKLPLMNVLSMTIGFLIVAYMVRSNRQRHFLIVGVFLWLLGTLPNVVHFFQGATVDLIILSLAMIPLIAFAAMLGGGIGSVLFKAKKK